MAGSGRGGEQGVRLKPQASGRRRRWSRVLGGEARHRRRRRLLGAHRSRRRSSPRLSRPSPSGGRHSPAASSILPRPMLWSDPPGREVLDDPHHLMSSIEEQRIDRKPHEGGVNGRPRSTGSLAGRQAATADEAPHRTRGRSAPRPHTGTPAGPIHYELCSGRHWRGPLPCRGHGAPEVGPAVCDAPFGRARLESRTRGVETHWPLV